MIFTIISVIGKSICGVIVIGTFILYPLYVDKKEETQNKVNEFLRTIHDDDISMSYDRMIVMDEKEIKEILQMNKQKDNEGQTSSSHNESSIQEDVDHESKEKI